MVVDREEARMWADHHGAFSAWVSDVAQGVADAFRVLARVQYERPWQRAEKPCVAACAEPRVRH